MTNPNHKLIQLIEHMIQDNTNEKNTSRFDTEGRWILRLNRSDFAVYERIYYGKTGNLGYYGIPFWLEGATDMAFYKSLDGSFYFIESRNDIPINYSKIE